MKKLAMMIVILASTVFIAKAQDVVGDWQGTLKAGGAELRLALHITKAEGGELNATLDSIDQGANGIPASAITLKDSQLNLTVEAWHGTYEGKVNAAATEIDGTWTQGQSLPLNFKRAVAQPAHKPAPPSEIDGTWLGTLDAGNAKLHLFFKIVNTQDGLTATMQSSDQSPQWIPATSVTRTGTSLTIEIKGIGASFAGKIGADRSSISGTFTQAGKAFPLWLQRVKD